MEQLGEYKASNHPEFAPIGAVPCWHSSPGSSWESRELLSKKELQAGPQEVSWGRRELCSLNCWRPICCRPKIELFLHTHTGWWRRSCPFGVVWHVTWRSLREKLGERRSDGGVQIRVSVICAKAQAVGAEINEEPPSRRECLAFLPFTGWFSSTAPSVQNMYCLQICKV